MQNKGYIIFVFQEQEFLTQFDKNRSIELYIQLDIFNFRTIFDREMKEQL